MGYFCMSDVHFVDNEFLHSQHASILSCMANVSKCLLAGIKGQDLFEQVDRLDAYCKLHFLDEEKLMEKMDFKEIEVHKAQHALFVRHLEKFMSRSEELNCDRNIKELNSLKDWYLEHIAAFDKEFAESMVHSTGAVTEPCH